MDEKIIPFWCGNDVTSFAYLSPGHDCDACAAISGADIGVVEAKMVSQIFANHPDVDVVEIDGDIYERWHYVTALALERALRQASGGTYLHAEAVFRGVKPYAVGGVEVFHASLAAGMFPFAVTASVREDKQSGTYYALLALGREHGWAQPAFRGFESRDALVEALHKAFGDAVRIWREKE